MSGLFRSICLSLLFLPNLTAAQTGSPLTKGQRVRVVSRCEVARSAVAECPAPGKPWPYPSLTYRPLSPTQWTYTGQLEALDADTLRIRVPSNDVAFAFPTAVIAGVSVVDGRRSHALEGAGIGLLGGVVLGAVVGSTMEWCFFGCSAATGFGVIIGAPAGLLIGTVIGAVTRSDRWRSVSIGDHPIRVAPRLDALGVTLTVMF